MEDFERDLNMIFDFENKRCDNFTDFCLIGMEAEENIDFSLDVNEVENDFNFAYNCWKGYYYI